MILNEYKNAVGTVASIATILQMFSPIFICKDIIKQQNTNGIDATPFLGGIGISALFLQNGLLIDDPASVYVNVVGILLNLAYLTVYYKYTGYKNKLWISVSKTVIFIALLIGYAQKEDSELVEFRFGLIITVILLFLIGAPLLNTNEIIRKKDASSIPIPIVIAGTFVMISWFLYGLILDNIFMQVQNLIGLILSVIQLYLYILYRPKKSAKKTAPKSKPNKAKVN